MSREVRRVPLDWKHPTEPNPYWEFQAENRRRHGDPDPLLHPVDERFVPLLGDYSDSRAQWEKDVVKIYSRQGRTWDFNVKYHLIGYQDREGAQQVPRPFYAYDSEDPIMVRDTDHLQDLLVAAKTSEKPKPEDYMPVWRSSQKYAWCLYETVTEGTPVTPVFATAEALIEHLTTVGQDYDQTPLRYESARAIVYGGGTMGSAVMVGGVVYNSTTDADILSKRSTF